jgi:hypothetical protein
MVMEFVLYNPKFNVFSFISIIFQIKGSGKIEKILKLNVNVQALTP